MLYLRQGHPLELHQPLLGHFMRSVFQAWGMWGGYGHVHVHVHVNDHVHELVYACLCMCTRVRVCVRLRAPVVSSY
jgi:hypothetical protein